MSDLVPALKIIAYQSGFSRLDGFELLKTLKLPVPDHLIINPDQLKAIENQSLTTLHPLLDLYHTKWHEQFVSVQPNNFEPNCKNYCVKGNANLFESILLCAECSTFEQPVLLQKTPQPSFGGKIITYNPLSGNKNQYYIVATNGCFIENAEDHFTHLIWDIRTQQAVHTLQPKRAKTGARQMDQVQLMPAHADEQIPPVHLLKELAGYAQHTTLKLFTPVELSWEIVQGTLVFTALRKLEHHIKKSGSRETQLIDIKSWSVQPKIESKTEESKIHISAIARGKRITPGIISGIPYELKTKQSAFSKLLTKPGQKKATTTSTVQGDILIVDTLRNKDLSQLKQVSGIICYSPIKDGAVVAFIKKHHIPCVTSVKPKISPKYLNSELVLNATLGVVSVPVAGSKKIKQQHVMLETDQNKTGLGSLPRKLTPTTFMKVFRWQKNPDAQAPMLVEQSRYPSVESYTADGSVYSNDFLLQLQGIHPIHRIKRNEKLFTLELANTLLRIYKNEGLAAYQTFDLHEGTLTKLQFSPQDGPISHIDQENPAFGVRGGLQIVHDSTLFEAELTALARVAQATRRDLPCIVPYIRTVSELMLVIDLLERINQRFKTNISLYLRIDLPSQIHQLQYFMRPAVKGIVLNLPTLHAHAYGIDQTNAFLTRQYPLDKTLAKQYLAQVTTQCTHLFPIWMILDTNSNELITAARDWGVSAIITKANQVKACKITLQES